VRHIKAGKHGDYFAVINTGFRSHADAVVKLPVAGTVTDAVCGDTVGSEGQVTTEFYPFELKAYHVAGGTRR